MKQTNLQSRFLIFAPAILACVFSIFTNDAAAQTTCLTAPANLQVFVPGENSPSDVQSINTNAQLAGNAAYDAGKVGRGFKFSGGGDYVRLEDNAAQRPANQFTVEGWFNFSSYGNEFRSLLKKSSADPQYGSYEIFIYGGLLTARATNGVMLGNQLNYSLNPTPGQWYHIAFTFQNGGNEFLYVNGTAVDFNAANFAPAYANTPLIIGDDSGSSILGQVDEISVYGRALSSAEISNIVQADSFGKCSGSINSQCANAPANQIGWYRGENNANDSAGSVNGTNSGVTYAPGKVGQSFFFDNPNDAITTTTAFSQAYSQLSVEAWVYPTSYATGDIDGLAVVSLLQDGGFALNVSDGKLKINYRLTSGQNPRLTAPDPSQLPLNQWSHIAMTYNGSVIKGYVNGVEVITEPATGTIRIGQTANTCLMIGNEPSATCGTVDVQGQNAWRGGIDEPSIYNRGLSAAEIQSIYNAGSAGKCLTSVCTNAPNNLVSWFAGEQNALDSKSNNHGTLQNGATFSTGRVGQTFDFSNGNAHVSIPDSASLRPTNFTIEGWFNFSSYTNDYRQLVGKKTSDSAYSSYGIYIINGLLTAMAGNDINLPVNVTYSLNPVPGQWYHIAFTWQSGGSGILYVNGAAVGSQAANITPAYTNTPLIIGDNFGYSILGKGDELSIYNRALSASEIQSIYNAASSGKCKPVGLNPAANQIAWYSGDGDARDFAGEDQNGTISGATFRIGKVGQAFSFDGANNYVQTPTLNLGANYALEFWINPTASGFGRNIISNYWTSTTDYGGLYFYTDNAGAGHLEYYAASSLKTATGASSVPANTWSHIGLTYDGSKTRLYINGVLAVTESGTHTETFNNTVRLGAGNNDGAVRFLGLLDEVSFYNRTISASEIAAVYNAGTAGKLKGKITAVNFQRSAKTAASLAPTTVQLADATVTFRQVTTAGTTSQNNVDLGFLPPLPEGATFTGLAYDVSTTAGYQNGSADDVRVCFNVPSLSALYNFQYLRIYHLENGAWINRTDTISASPSLCTNDLTSLSPFVIAEFVPLAASASLGGRVLDQNGTGVSRTTITLTDLQGNRRQVLTNGFGFYNFEVEVGQTYILTAKSKRYSFAPPTQVVNVNDNVSEINFIAQPVDSLMPDSTDKNENSKQQK